MQFITRLPNGPVLFCSMAYVVGRLSSSSVTLPAGGRVGGRTADTARRASTVTSRYIYRATLCSILSVFICCRFLHLYFHFSINVYVLFYFRDELTYMVICYMPLTKQVLLTDSYGLKYIILVEPSLLLAI